VTFPAGAELDTVMQVQVRHSTKHRHPNEDTNPMAKSGKLSILYGESESQVLTANAAAMEQAGHTVHQAIGRKKVEASLKAGAFDLVVLGPTLARNDRHHLPYMVKKASAITQVLVMHADGSRHPYVDACTDTGASLENVLHRIEAMNLAGTNVAGTKPAASAAAAGR
jgi:hypothetical protein